MADSIPYLVPIQFQESIFHPLTLTLRQVFICQRSLGWLNQREGQRGSSSQSWVENTNMTMYLQSYNLINTCSKVRLQVKFLYDYILLWFLYSYLTRGVEVQFFWGWEVRRTPNRTSQYLPHNRNTDKSYVEQQERNCKFSKKI
jgi:hypothetical protein